MDYTKPVIVDEMTRIDPVVWNAIFKRAGINLNPPYEWIQFKKFLNMGSSCE